MWKRPLPQAWPPGRSPRHHEWPGQGRAYRRWGGPSDGRRTQWGERLAFGIQPPMALDQADHDIAALTPEAMPLAEHRVGLAHAGRGAKVGPERSAIV